MNERKNNSYLKWDFNPHGSFWVWEARGASGTKYVLSPSPRTVEPGDHREVLVEFDIPSEGSSRRVAVFRTFDDAKRYCEVTERVECEDNP